jgi:hypothetical protein
VTNDDDRAPQGASMYVDTRYFYVRPPRTVLVWTFAALVFLSGAVGGWWLGHEQPSSETLATVEGVVLTTEGLPVPGASVEFLGRTVAGEPVALITHADEHGRYRLSQLPVPVAYVTRIRADDVGVRNSSRWSWNRPTRPSRRT